MPIYTTPIINVKTINIRLGIQATKSLTFTPDFTSYIIILAIYYRNLLMIIYFVYD